MTPGSALYVGSVMHRRLRPKRHALRYNVFWLLLDLDEINDFTRRLRLFSRGRFNAVSFIDKDHGEQTNEPLRDQVERHLRNAGIDLGGGPIRLLCMPRIFGYGFNPLSIYFCYLRDGQLAALLHEVHNTFGERHSYLIPVTADADRVIEQHCDKRFYVSPFMDMGLRYHFRVVPPGDGISVAISASDDQGVMLTAALTGQRRTLSDRALLGLLIRIPVVTLKVTGAIHWHALKIWWKGIAPRARPPAPTRPVTIVSSQK